MEHTHTKLYEVFGELLYVLAMADGIIQEEEISTLKNLLANHPAAADIKWSFDYEQKKGRSTDEVYAKVIDYCRFAGPSPEYQNMVDIMEAMAKSSAGIDKDEQKVMNSFSNTLLEQFKKDLETI